jgi:hypothetical protein
MSKICSKCKVNKELLFFGKLKSSKDGFRYDCKICRKDYRNNNKDIIKENQKKYYNKNKNDLLDKNKIYRLNNRDVINLQKKEYREKPDIKEHIKQKNKEYLEIRKYKIKIKRQTDLNFRLSEVYRSKFHKFIKNYNTLLTTTLGCDYNYFKLWIEYNFDNNMSWDNYGTYWDLDHVLPLSKFNFNDDNDIKLCYNWCNFKPLNKSLNIKKSNNILINYINEHIKNLEKFICLNTNYEYQKISEMKFWLREKTQVW